MNSEVESEKRSYEEDVFYVLERKFNRGNQIRTFYGIIIGGALITMMSVIYTMMAGGLGEPSKVDMCVK